MWLSVRSKLIAWYLRLGFAVSVRHRCCIDVRLLLPEPQEREALFRKVQDAIKLIGQYNPARLQRIKRDLRGVWITGTGGNVGEYHHNVGLCLLDRNHLSKPEVSPLHVAATIVHEATHARLRLAGFGYEPTIRARIENVCFRREIAFASRLPDGKPILDLARAQIARDPTVWTSEAARGRATTKLRELGVPEWVIRLIIR